LLCRSQSHSVVILCESETIILSKITQYVLILLVKLLINLRLFFFNFEEVLQNYSISNRFIMEWVTRKFRWFFFNVMLFTNIFEFFCLDGVITNLRSTFVKEYTFIRNARNRERTSGRSGQTIHILFIEP